MKPHTGIAALCLVAVLQGCLSAGERASALRRESLASGVCTIHHVALQRTTMYDLTTEAMPADIEEFDVKAAWRFPNVALGYSPTRVRRYRKPVAVRICPTCERFYRAPANDLTRRCS